MTNVVPVPRPASREWIMASDAHQAAVARFATAARGIGVARWEMPLAPGKWSPAEVAAHLIDAYGVLCRELAGGAGMRLLGTAPSRWLLRHLVLPRLLRGAPFPRGVPAPVETRPVTVLANPDEAVTLLERVASQFATELSERQALGPVWLTHAYFGRLSALQAIRLATVHTRHHARQLERP